ncbi:DUF6705 family protein [Nonlabens sp. SY33080]|uniref:DUF6705 family protein n=1 Tax=Nonlabens sp. SY33080 TaxID=2719911 RepID=UPI001428BDC1|nr:DUF6705 family protein [Nonlabens sp. SY33080]
MKRLIILILILITGKLAAQTIVPIENETQSLFMGRESIYFKDVNGVYNKFLGSWKYQDPSNSNTVLEINVVKSEREKYGKHFIDEIYIEFKYVENGTVIYDSSNYTLEMKKRTISGSISLTNPFNTVCSLIYFEPTNIPWSYKAYKGCLSPSLTLEYVNEIDMNNGQRTYLKWDVCYVVDPAQGEVWPFKIPNHIELERI